GYNEPTYTVDFSYPEYAPQVNRTREREKSCVVVRSCFYRESLPNGSLFIQTCGTCP
ncbi:hypothetical protein GIB67_010355, partial [Kingdonia uniflora]